MSGLRPARVARKVCWGRGSARSFIYTRFARVFKPYQRKTRVLWKLKYAPPWPLKINYPHPLWGVVTGFQFNLGYFAMEKVLNWLLCDYINQLFSLLLLKHLIIKGYPNMITYMWLLFISTYALFICRHTYAWAYISGHSLGITYNSLYILHILYIHISWHPHTNKISNVYYLTTPDSVKRKYISLWQTGREQLKLPLFAEILVI